MKPNETKKEITKNPAEQREHDHKREGVVKKDAPTPRQSQLEQERGDWEGMGGTQPSSPKK